MTTTAKRTIRGEKHNISEIVIEAMQTVSQMTLDITAARERLALLGNTKPSDAQVEKFARDAAILGLLQKATGAAFNGQIGKISFDNQETAIRQANDYLDRRNAGHRANWGKR